MAYLLEPSVLELAELMVAFANSEGGTIVIGMSAEQKPAGRPLFAEEVQGVLLAAERLCRPIVQTGWEQFENNSGLFAIRVPRSIELHSLEDGRVLVRAGRENRPLAGEQIQHLASNKSTGEFELQEVPGATRADLDEGLIAEYLQKRQARQRREITATPDELLREIGALSPAGCPTLSGLLLFCRNPQIWLPYTGLLFVKFSGTEPRGEDGNVGYGRREEIDGNLARVIERAWQVIIEEMAVGAVVRGLEREEVFEYPRFAVREALVNAVCHRDYRLKGRKIEVRMYTDRMEIISPGGLPGYITLDNIVEEHYSRNPRIVNGLYQWGYIEELGLGIDYMIEAMTNAGHAPPDFSARPHAFTVKLFNNRERKMVAKGFQSMNERQARALTFIREHGNITNSDYQALCPDVSPETLRLDFADLVKRGIILKVGAKRGTYYILK
ncbi:MAG TPA: ATP-binding protein [Anaerolineales bacterium]|nr:ATP-binding protein [Anaerolineales bacterium]